MACPLPAHVLTGTWSRGSRPRDRRQSRPVRRTPARGDSPGTGTDALTRDRLARTRGNRHARPTRHGPRRDVAASHPSVGRGLWTIHFKQADTAVGTARNSRARAGSRRFATQVCRDGCLRRSTLQPDRASKNGFAICRGSVRGGRVSRVKRSRLRCERNALGAIRSCCLHGDDNPRRIGMCRAESTSCRSLDRTRPRTCTGRRTLDMDAVQ